MVSKSYAIIFVCAVFFSKWCEALSTTAPIPRIDLTPDKFLNFKICVDLNLSEKEDEDRKRSKIYTLAISYPSQLNGADFLNSRVYFNDAKDSSFRVDHDILGPPQRGAFTFWVSPSQIQKMTIELSYSGEHDGAIYVMDFSKLTSKIPASTGIDYPNGNHLNFSCRNKLDR